jgi:hypothetical protein
MCGRPEGHKRRPLRVPSSWTAPTDANRQDGEGIRTRGSSEYSGSEAVPQDTNCFSGFLVRHCRGKELGGLKLSSTGSGNALL